jgi:hypothetical protein
MTKTYDVTCPDSPFCGEEFEVELDPATEEDCIECPFCGAEFGWDHDTVTDTITLVPNEDDEIDETPLADDDEGEEELA